MITSHNHNVTMDTAKGQKDSDGDSKRAKGLLIHRLLNAFITWAGERLQNKPLKKIFQTQFF